MSAKVALRRAYDLDNGVYSDTVDKKDPFSLIAMHPTEEAANNGKWIELLNRYRTHQIKEYFSFNFTEWVSQPNDLVEKQINLSILWREQELRKAENVTAEVEKQQGINKP